MKTYAKIQNGALVLLPGVPHISNPKPSTLEDYARANGYKPYEFTPPPGEDKNYKHTYAENALTIFDLWQEIHNPIETSEL